MLAYQLFYVNLVGLDYCKLTVFTVHNERMQSIKGTLWFL